jgi:hypothetical protein
MPSHGALKDAAATEAPKPAKKALMHMLLKKADNGGVVAEHRMNTFDGKEPVHAFGAEEGHKLAAHIEKHLGISMPGRSKVDSAEETEGDQE